MARNPPTKQTSDDPYRENDRFVIRRILIPITVFFVLVGSFYGIENWRGEQAWKDAVAELTAKGETLDWKKFVPEPVPDEENMLKAPHMEDWFVHGNAPFKDDTFLQPLLDANKQRTADGPVPIGTLRLVSPEEAVPGPNVFDWGKARSVEGLKPVEKALLKQMGLGGRMWWYYNVTITESFPTFSTSVRLEFSASPFPDLASLQDCFRILPMRAENGTLSPCSLTVEPTADPQEFSLLLTRFDGIAAANFLKATDQFAEVFNELTKAGMRRSSYLPGNYETVATAPQISYSPFRRLSQMLKIRIENHLGKGEYEQAYVEARALAALCQLLPTDSLRSIHSGFSCLLYDQFFLSVRQGLEVGAWNGVRLEHFAQEAARMEFLKLVAMGLKAERAREISIMKMVDPSAAKICQQPKETWPEWAQKVDDFIWKFAPQGWVKQNIASYMMDTQLAIDGLSRETPSSTAVSALDSLCKQLEASGIYDRISAASIPFDCRMCRQAFHTQTQAHLVILGCALERHRMETGRFPETLAALSPAYLAKAPVQVVNGQPFLYRREADGGYSLWSVGWDLKDGGGVFQVGDEVREDKPDWGWRMPLGREPGK